MPRFPALAVAALIAACCTSSCASAESANSAAESFAPPTIWRLLGGGRGAAPPVATAIRRQLGGEPKIGDDCHRATVIDDCGVYGCDYKDFRERGEGSAACKKALGDRCGQFLSLGDQERYEINCERCMVDKEKELDAANCTSAAKNGFCNKDPDIGVCAVCTDDNMCRCATPSPPAPAAPSLSTPSLVPLVSIDRARTAAGWPPPAGSPPFLCVTRSERAGTRTHTQRMMLRSVSAGTRG